MKVASSAVLQLPQERDPLGWLESVDLARSGEEIALASGRTIRVDQTGGVDRLAVRARDGSLILTIELDDRGPRLRFSGADVAVEATGLLELRAERLNIDVAGDMSTSVGGDRHSRIQGDERVEAACVEVQANNAGVALRALDAIRLDGEHIGLNDDPAPVPFGWSALAQSVEPRKENS